MFLENAKECKMIHKPRKDMPSQKSNVSKKSWFDGNCMNARKEYHKAKRVYVSSY